MNDFTATQIRAYMAPVPYTIGADVPLRRAIEIMRERDVRHLPVQLDGQLIGVLSERDVKRAISLHPGSAEALVAQVMTEEPYAVAPDASMRDVLAAMGIHKYGCAVVVNEAGRAVGIFTAIDAVRLLGRVFDDRARDERAGFETPSDRAEARG